MDKKRLPPELRDDKKRQDFAQRLYDLKEAALREHDLKPRWDAIKGFYDGAAVPWSCRYWKGAVLRHFPLIKPKVDALSSFVLGTIQGQTPMMLATLTGSTKRLEQVEKQLQFFFKIGRLSTALEEVSPISGMTNCGIVRVTFDTASQGFLPLKPARGQQMHGPVAFTGLKFDVIHPSDFVIYPASIYGIGRAQLTGHRFWLQKCDIEQLQSVGRYIDDFEVHPGDGPDNAPGSRRNQSEAPKPKDAPVELFELIVRADLGADQQRGTGGKFAPKQKYNERYYRCTLCCDPIRLLRIEPWNLSRPNYAEFRYQPKEYGSWWPSGSVGNDLQGLQMHYIDVRNLIHYGSVYSAFLPIFTDATLPAKHTSVLPGNLHGAPGNISSPTSGFDPKALNFELEWIHRDADAVVRIPQNATGQQSTENGQPITARESGQLASALDTSINGYISTFGNGMTEIAEISSELLFLNADVWQDVYGGPDLPEQLIPLLQQAGIEPGESQVYVSDPKDFLLPLQWELHGKTQESSPDVQGAKIMSALQIAQGANARAMMEGKPTVPYDIEKMERAAIGALNILNAESFMPEGGVPVAPQLAGQMAAGMPPPGGDPALNGRPKNGQKVPA